VDVVSLTAVRREKPLGDGRKIDLDFVVFFWCGGAVFLLAFLRKSGFHCGVFVVVLW
jgi:hypothetical protein